jgi:xanthine dehydrogenase accessory factor
MEEFMEVASRVVGLLENDKTFCLATVVDSGRREVSAGSKAIVFSDGSMEGSLGSESLDQKLRDLCPTFFKENKSRTISLEDTVRVFINILTSETKLLMCGAGHIAIPLAQFAHRVGFHVTVLDDRPDFAHPSRFPDCAVMAEDFTPALRVMPLGPTTYVVVITRGHEHDTDCLIEILKKDAAYVGLIGSRRRVRIVLEMLAKEGIPDERLKKVFTPIGLPIGADSPEEIALSIVSELVCVRRKGSAQARALRGAVGIDI